MREKKKEREKEEEEGGEKEGKRRTKSKFLHLFFSTVRRNNGTLEVHFTYE